MGTRGRVRRLTPIGAPRVFARRIPPCFDFRKKDTCRRLSPGRQEGPLPWTIVFTSFHIILAASMLAAPAQMLQSAIRHEGLSPQAGRHFVHGKSFTPQRE